MGVQILYTFPTPKMASNKSNSSVHDIILRILRFLAESSGAQSWNSFNPFPIVNWVSAGVPTPPDSGKTPQQQTSKLAQNCAKTEVLHLQPSCGICWSHEIETLPPMSTKDSSGFKYIIFFNRMILNSGRHTREDRLWESKFYIPFQPQKWASNKSNSSVHDIILRILRFLAESSGAQSWNSFNPFPIVNWVSAGVPTPPDSGKTPQQQTSKLAQNCAKTEVLHPQPSYGICWSHEIETLPPMSTKDSSGFKYIIFFNRMILNSGRHTREDRLWESKFYIPFQPQKWASNKSNSSVHDIILRILRFLAESSGAQSWNSFNPFPIVNWVSAGVPTPPDSGKTPQQQTSKLAQNCAKTEVLHPQPSYGICWSHEIETLPPMSTKDSSGFKYIIFFNRMILNSGQHTREDRLWESKFYIPFQPQKWASNKSNSSVHDIILRILRFLAESSGAQSWNSFNPFPIVNWVSAGVPTPPDSGKTPQQQTSKLAQNCAKTEVLHLQPSYGICWSHEIETLPPMSTKDSSGFKYIIFFNRMILNSGRHTREDRLWESKFYIPFQPQKWASNKSNSLVHDIILRILRFLAESSGAQSWNSFNPFPIVNWVSAGVPTPPDSGKTPQQQTSKLAQNCAKTEVLHLQPSYGICWSHEIETLPPMSTKDSSGFKYIIFFNRMILNSGQHTQPDPQSCRVRSLGGRRGEPKNKHRIKRPKQN